MAYPDLSADRTAPPSSQAPHRASAPPSLHPARSARALTLVELLVVIVVLGILASIGVTLASKVTQGGRVSITQDAIKVADQALHSYVQQKETIPPPVFEDPRYDPGQFLMPVADARNMGHPDVNERKIINSCGLFIYQAEKEAGLTGLFANLDARILQRYDGDRTDNVYAASGGGGAPDPTRDQMSKPWPSTQFDQPWIPTLMDGWGRPLRYVHPAFGGLINGPDRRSAAPGGTAATPLSALESVSGYQRNNQPPFTYTPIRRNAANTGNRPEQQPDSDGGRPVGNRPYFYSAGPDADPSTRTDNVYSTMPQWDFKEGGN